MIFIALFEVFVKPRFAVRYNEVPPLLSAQMKVMISKVESDIQAFNVELEKFGSRWHQLKPRDDIAMGGDKETTAHALASLKERREEFKEMVAVADKLR